ncbi:hypothetical protein Lal_00035479 [Lupinus albus]|nr:hypothetical protein Lal_00035479 [Lupinus albus]
MMLISYAAETDFEFYKSLFPVAVAHTIGHVAATVILPDAILSLFSSKLPIIGGCALAAFVVEYSKKLEDRMLNSLLYTHNFSARTALHPPNFDFTIFRFSCFMGTMISSLAFVLRNISSKKSMRGKLVSIMNYYACLSTLSLVILTPFAMAVEGPQMWTAGYRTTFSNWTPIFMVITNDMQARLVGTSANRPCKRP